MKQKTIKQWVKLLEQEELPVKQLLFDFSLFQQCFSDDTSKQLIMTEYIKCLKSRIKPKPKQQELFI